MGIRRSGLLACAWAVVAGTAAAAAERATPRPTDYPDEIVVLSQRELAKAVFKDNLEELTAPISVVDAIPRFYAPLCIDVAGVAAADERFIVDRILATSFELGLPPPRENCRINAIVAVVHDPEQAFEHIVSKRLDMFGVLPFRDVHVRRIRDAVRAGDPVVWWSVIATAESEGVPAVSNANLMFSNAISASRTQSGLFRPKSMSVVLYDARQLGGANLGQIADHAALHLLGMPRRGANFGGVVVPSLLTMFSDGPEFAPQGLTDFDRAYLQGLYALPPGAYQSRVPAAVVAAYAERCEAQRSECRIRLRN